MGHRRIAIVDQLRGLAALSVAWFHLTNWSGGWVASSGAWGWLGVEAFFVISGFAIPYSLGILQPRYGKRDFGCFIARRFVRIEVPYVASIAVVIVVNMLASASPMFRGAPPGYEASQVIANMLYLVPLTEFRWIQPVYWSLAWEFVFYLGIGILFPFIGLGGSKWAARGACVSLIALVHAGLLSHYVLHFVMGFAVYRRLVMRDEFSWTMALMAASGLVICKTGAWSEAAVGTATAAIILSHRIVPHVGGRLGSALSALGMISYSLYLLHIPIGSKIVNFGLRFVEWGPGRLLLSIAALVISIIAARAFWKLIEQPSTIAARQIQKWSEATQQGAILRNV
jgi:peptidoglycan/LPS O-acetylase OafA/YrhL